MYGWKSKEYNNVRDALESQNHNAQVEFKDRLNKTILAFAEEGINTALYWENQDPLEYVSFCPTSAITGEGLPDLMIYISQMCQTYQRN
jgi:translation initiation factor 5B